MINILVRLVVFVKLFRGLEHFVCQCVGFVEFVWLVRVVAFIELCQGVEILSASECGLLSMSSCVVLTVLKKGSIIEFAYLLRSCVKLHRGVKF